MSSAKNKKISFLVPYPTGIAPGQRFRFEQYLDQMTKRGYVVKLFPFLSPRSNEILYQPGHVVRKITGVLAGLFRRITQLPEILRSDFVYIFREATPVGPPLFEWLIGPVFRKKIIYDFDDAIWLSNTSTENKFISGLKFHRKVRSICRWSYKVSCGNKFLADFARKYNNAVIINPTTIDTIQLHNASLYHVKKNDHQVVVGWTGTHSTLPYLKLLLPIVEKLQEKYPAFRLLVIADKKPDWVLPCLQFTVWNKDTEIIDLLRMDIGIMPLLDDDWSRGKCGFKALQYMSLEKPALVSPVGVNERIVDHEVNGFHCSTPDEWLEHLEFLVNNQQARIEFGKKGRAKVIRDYSVVSNSDNFFSLFE